MIVAAAASTAVGAPATVGQSSARHTPQSAVADGFKLPLAFEPNVGQAGAGTDFVARGDGFSMGLDASGATLAAPGAKGAPAVARLKLVGADPGASATAQDPLAGKVNYLVGNDPAKWHTDVATFGAVDYHGVYPGVDARYYGHQGHLEYDLTLAPGADTGVIKLGFDGATGVQLTPSGDLTVSTPGGDLKQAAPQLYQDLGGRRRPVSGHFALRGSGQVGLVVGAYDHTAPLVIDPTIAYSTYLGGSGSENGNDVAIDAASNAYVAGFSDSANFPATTGAFQTTPDGLRTGYVAKFNPSGSLVYATFLGGSTDESLPSGIAVDGSGNAVVSGATGAQDYPTTSSALQPHPVGGAFDWGFLTELNATGSGLLYSTYVGEGVDVSTDQGSATGVALDSSGNAYFATDSFGPDYPTTPGAFQASPAGGADAVVTKINLAAGGAASLVYSTYVGGTDYEYFGGIAVDSAGNAVVEGSTSSTDFPVTPGAFQSANHGAPDLFVFKLNPTGSGLAYSTYLGGSGSEYNGVGDQGGVAVDSTGNAYVASGSSSTDFPTTAGAYQTTNKGGADAVVARFDPTGALVYSTYLGGTSDDFGRDVAVGPGGTVYVVGDTASPDFPTADPTQPAPGGNGDGFVAQLSPDGSALSFATYLGGTAQESAFGVAATADLVDVVGSTGSADFPTVNPSQPAFGGGNQDAFVTSYVVTDLVSIAKTASPVLADPGQPVTYTLAVQNPGSVGPASKVKVTDKLPVGVAFVSATSSVGSCAQASGTVTCALGTMAPKTDATVTLTVTAPNGPAKLTNTAKVSSAGTDPHPANNTGTAVVYVDAADLALTKTSSPDVAAAGQAVTYTLTAANNGPNPATGVKIVDPLPAGVAFRSASSTQGKCTQSGGVVTCKLGALAVGSQATVTIKGVPSGSGRTTNTATLSSNQPDQNTTDNAASAQVTAMGPGCGQVVSKTTTLTADIGPCAGDGVVIGANDITLDLGGHRIFGFGPSLGGTHPGIRMPDRTGVTITNGAVSGFDAGIFVNSGGGNTFTHLNIHDNIGPDIPGFGSQLGDGIAVIHSASNVITDNTINHNGTYDGVGIFGQDASFNLVKNNTISNSVGSVVDRQDGEGIAINSLLEPSDPRRADSVYGNNLIGNTIVGNEAMGIVSTSNLNATIEGNDVERNGLDVHMAPDSGISIQNDFRTDPNTNDLVKANKVFGNGGDGIELRAVGGNHVINNRTDGNGVNGYDEGPSLFLIFYDLHDRDPDCGTNVWRGNTWGSGGYNPPCVTAGGSGPAPPAAPAMAPAAAPAAQSAALELRHDIPR